MKSGFIQLSAIFLLLVSCKKNNQVEGRVVNFLTGQPIKGLQINVDGHNSGFSSSKKGLQRLSSVVSGDDGTFKANIKFKENKRSYFDVSIDPVHTQMDQNADFDMKYFADPALCPGSASYYGSRTKPPDNIEFRVAPASRIMLQSQYGMSSFYTLNITLYVGSYYNNIICNRNDFYNKLNKYIQVPSNGKVYIKYYGDNNPARYDSIMVAPFAKATYLMRF
jgi:hypothetical protein